VLVKVERGLNPAVAEFSVVSLHIKCVDDAEEVAVNVEVGVGVVVLLLEGVFGVKGICNVAVHSLHQ
jgi:hypothetical protein